LTLISFRDYENEKEVYGLLKTTFNDQLGVLKNLAIIADEFDDAEQKILL